MTFSNLIALTCNITLRVRKFSPDVRVILKLPFVSDILSTRVTQRVRKFSPDVRVILKLPFVSDILSARVTQRVRKFSPDVRQNWYEEFLARTTQRLSRHNILDKPHQDPYRLHADFSEESYDLRFLQLRFWSYDRD